MSEPTRKYSVTLPRDIAEEARTRGGGAGLSAYVTAAVKRQLERDALRELVEAAEAEHGPITEEEVAARRAALAAARTDAA
ncbi:hypothetical protein [Actinomadura flavalba]|uniref:hypothetical protein n=1 Tax=Actinomadura flavalba TaxID=1120938 RepID=UPI0003781D3D|nr:hypothetical protein [Actinomadura flavalba]